MTTSETMTHAQALTEVAQWQTHLQNASQALAAFDLGRYALEHDVDQAVAHKARLEAECLRCEAGLATAQAQVTAVQRSEQLVNAAQMEQEAAELEKEGAVVMARIQELSDELTPLHEQARYLAHRTDLLRTHAAELRRLYGGTA